MKYNLRNRGEKNGLGDLAQWFPIMFLVKLTGIQGRQGADYYCICWALT